MMGVKFHITFFKWGPKNSTFFKSKILKILRSIDSSTKNCRKKFIYLQKMSVRSIPNYPANLATFEESCIFGRPKHPFRTPVVPKRAMMWCEILRPSFFLYIAHCLCRDGHLWRGVGVCLSVVGKQSLSSLILFSK